MTKTGSYSPQEDSTIRTMLAAGKNAGAIGKELNRSYDSVRGRIKTLEKQGNLAAAPAAEPQSTSVSQAPTNQRSTKTVPFPAFSRPTRRLRW